jgi:hypothetical protein
MRPPQPNYLTGKVPTPLNLSMSFFKKKHISSLLLRKFQKYRWQVSNDVFPVKKFPKYGTHGVP